MATSIKEFFKLNKYGFIVSSIILLLGAIVITMKQKTFELNTFVLWFPAYYSIFLIFSIGIAYAFFEEKNQ